MAATSTWLHIVSPRAYRTFRFATDTPHDLNDLSGIGLTYNDALIRAEAVPEPSSLLPLCMLAASGLVFRSGCVAV